MTFIEQQNNFKLIQIKKTVDWLVNETYTSIFDPVTFEGYQRSIDDNHCSKIVKYLENSFFLPTAIICACDYKYDDTTKLRIVDGQHRIQAFKLLKQTNLKRYDEIKNYELAVIVLEKPSLIDEINTFVTINKTSKKVDTSLAFVLKNKLNQEQNSNDLSISKKEYLSVEVAWKLSNLEESIWYDKILFEGNVGKTSKTISLNAFVKSMRKFLTYLEKYRIIRIEWQDKNDINLCIENVLKILDVVWKVILNKWSSLYQKGKEDVKIIQGAIGFSAINSFIVLALKKHNKYMSMSEFIDFVSILFDRLDIPYENWQSGGKYSKFSSESGYAIIANELFMNC